MLMRSKLSPDCTKLIVSTQEGKLIMINNLSLTHLAEDMKEFLPHRFLTRTIHQRDSSLMNRKRRNYFEIINDWPLGNGAGDIASIQVHILERLDPFRKCDTTLSDKSISVSCDRSVVFPRCSGFLHQ